MKPSCLCQPIIEPKGSGPGQDRGRLGSCDRALFQVCIAKRKAKTGFEQPSHDQKSPTCDGLLIHKFTISAPPLHKSINRR
jgi:hypothetical protein